MNTNNNNTAWYDLWTFLLVHLWRHVAFLLLVYILDGVNSLTVTIDFTPSLRTAVNILAQFSCCSRHVRRTRKLYPPLAESSDSLPRAGDVSVTLIGTRCGVSLWVSLFKLASGANADCFLIIMWLVHNNNTMDGEILFSKKMQPSYYL